MHDPLDFTPVPGQTATVRHDGWTPARQVAFIAALAAIGLVSAAAKSVGMSRKSAYALRKRAGAESFAAAWDAALKRGQAEVLSIAIDRALHGVTTPVFYRGRKVGECQKFNDRLLIAAIRAIDPSYR
ncbi:hypothetical protein ASG11_10730 [Sphingomonas sp. Leaf357]|uniref:hypothetical protein n=1 Tax=Sphingomonas sp. Leaf357 TaxID=1736350 RepID=UPI0006F5C52F|nr:hypothetical protein [Sphingomonas sp. Leaf357]KQS04665.1 hypothetical protein ASG11_10730 [Sphingomonas sp. Leaf357]